MERKFLEDLGLEKDTIEKIMAQHGKTMSTNNAKITDLEEKLKSANNEIKTYQNKVNDLDKVNGDNAKVKEELENLKKEIAEEKQKAEAKKQDDILTNNIISVFGDKKFVNEYTKNAIVNDIKNALKDSTNVGKSAKDLFEEMTKDKEGIFESPNKVISTTPMGSVNAELAKENHDRELLGLEIKK